MTKSATFSLALGLVGAASAQTTPSTSSFANLNVDNGGGYTVLSGNSGGGSPVAASGTFSFTGKNGAGATQTMVFSGSATSSAQYGSLHGTSTASLQNSYYNSGNAPYADGNGGVANANGSPFDFASTTSSFFDDTLQFGGALQSGYKARYIFHVDGTNSGTGALTVLGVTIAGVNTTFGDGGTGAFVADWATGDIPINGQTPQSLHVQFDTLVSFGAQNLADGSSVNGMCDFSATARLAAVVVVDANGNPVSGVTFTSGSGTVYPTPEPASLAALGVGVLGLLRRRVRKAQP